MSSSRPSPPAYTELQYDDITSHIKSSIDLVNTLKEQTNNVLEKERALQKYKKSLVVGGGGCVDLDNGQLHAVHFLESLWKCTDNHQSSDEKNCTQPSSNVTAIVGGGLGVGKTMTVCALLCKNSVVDRDGGPQLIVCSPGSLVSVF